MDRLRKEGAAMVYRSAKQRSEPSSDKRGAKVDELHFTPLELTSRTVPTSGKYSNTLGHILSRRAYPRRVGHPCGMTVTRRWARVLAASQIGYPIGMGRCNPRQTTMSTSAYPCNTRSHAVEFPIRGLQRAEVQ